MEQLKEHNERLEAQAQTLDAQCLKDVQLACVYVNPKVLDALANALGAHHACSWLQPTQLPLRYAILAPSAPAARDGADGGRVGRGTTVQVERLEKRHLEGRGGRVNGSNYRYSEVGYTKVYQLQVLRRLGTQRCS